MPAPAAIPAALPGRPRLRLDDKVLALEFLLLDAQFNEQGRYQLVLRVENPLLDGSVEGVTVSVNQGVMVQGNQAESDIVEQEDLTDTICFQNNTYLFILPQGLCKNDKHHDVRLSIDVLKLEGKFQKVGKKVGQAIFAIYPRTNQPRINLRAARFQPLYNYQGILALLRVGGDHLSMHCGRLAYKVCFREYQPQKPEENPKQPSPRQNTIKAGTSQNGTPRSAFFQDSSTNPVSPVPTTSRTINSQADTPGVGANKTNAPKSSRTSTIQTPRTHQAVNDPKDPTSPSPTLNLHDMPPSETELLQDQDNYSDDLDDSPPVSPVRPVPSKVHHDAPLLLPSPPKTPATTRKTHVTEKPAAKGEPVRATNGQSSFLPSLGTETVVVTIHSASHLPSTGGGTVPSPFICLTNSLDERKGVGAQSISHAVQSPTHDPVWWDTLTMTVRENEAQQEDLILNVADSASLEVLLSYSLPLRDLQPFHTYYLCMVQPHSQAPGESHLYASVERRISRIPQQKEFTYSALQVLIVRVEDPVEGQSDGLLAVARIVPNYTEYRQSQVLREVHPVFDATVLFPDPVPTCFQVPSEASQGHPQLSPPGLPPSQPVWNYPFLFQGRDGVTLFSEGAALVLEYYPATADTRRVPWHLSDCCGFSVVPLDMRMYHELMKGSDKPHTLSVTIQGTKLQTLSGETPTVSLQLLLFRSEFPEFFLRPVELEPGLTLEHNHSPKPTQEIPVSTTNKREQLQRDGPSLPPHNALADILPNPWSHSMQAQQKHSDYNVPLNKPHASPYQQKQSNDVELPADPVVVHQEQELSNYRMAMQRMADDIIALRRQMSGLEAENSHLRSELSLHQDIGRNLLSDTDIDVMTKAEIADRMVTLKHKLASETSDLRVMRDRVQQLQNELVRKNDREKEQILLQRMHQQQQAVLNQYHQRLARSKTLQDTVRKQEKVIEKMEKLLDRKLKDEKRNRTEGVERGGRQDTLQADVHAALLSENSRLREELERMRVPTITQQPHILEAFSNSEKFSLMSKLEKSQARVQSLERELETAARRWGREKQQFKTQISEQEMGFSRTNTTILHHLPIKEPDPPIRRHAKLDPLI
ncbi:coiled-coil domain-containing protein 33 [Xenopus laevis]|uniref:Coiled-coil domain-containing protein 33 n=2 Tax=Xenopus laevis TaxID=8355 RepID=A0A1L8GZY7_XENLA|nr:coiled-coil domain-containing protein 33 [Xenopus laevis]OCT89414.1 hypothetical protein XELAEV_18018035mg [Xenopus laevis]